MQSIRILRVDEAGLVANDKSLPVFGIIDDGVYKGFWAITDDAVSGVVDDGDVAVGYLLPVNPGRFRRDQTVLASKDCQCGAMDITEPGLDA